MPTASVRHARVGLTFRVVVCTGAAIAGTLAGAPAWAQVRIVEPQSNPASVQTYSQPAAAPPQASTPRTPDEATMLEARRLIAGNRGRAAERLLDEWIEANQPLDHPQLPEAFYLRGNARLLQDDEFNALYDYEEVVQNYPGSEFFASSLERELDIARLYLAGRGEPGLFGLRIGSGRPLAEEIILRINERLPGSKLAERALMTLADSYARERDLRMAAETYDVFVKLYPRSPMLAKAMERRIYANVAQFKGPGYDVAVLNDARVQVLEFQERFPVQAQDSGLNDALVARLDESAAASMLVQARAYVRRDDPVSARAVLTRLIQRFPRTGAAHDAMQEVASIDASGEVPQVGPLDVPPRAGAGAGGAGTIEPLPTQPGKGS